MKTVKIYQVDAFTSERFKGNPAAVCIFDEWPEDMIMQQIAAENNLAETAFIINREGQYHIRWFTPVSEVALCGHATLASASVLFSFYEKQAVNLTFQSLHSGLLGVSKSGRRIELDFPADQATTERLPDIIADALNIAPAEVYKGRTDYMLVYNNQEEIEAIRPDFQKLGQLGARGIIVTAPGRDVDFVSRFFAPDVGINEDPVTGSAHTTLTPYWAERLGKKSLTALQLSSRTGSLFCTHRGNRVSIAGEAVLYLSGEIYLT